MTTRRHLPTVLVTALLLAAGCGGSVPDGAGVEADGAPTARGERPVGPPRNAPEHLDAPHVVLVAFDGLAWDVMDRYALPSFERVARAGVRAERMIPVYPTKTFVTLYSIATGMYAERHGLVGNRFWAPDLGAAYALSDRGAVEDGRFYRGEPIWVTAERQGMVAASFYFVGSEAPVGGVQPSYWHRFDAAVPHERRVGQVLEWLAMPRETRPHLITLYFEDVDAAWHFNGPDGTETLEALERVDRSLGRLLDGIQALPHAERVYVILVSDHGLMRASAEDVDYLDSELIAGVRVAETGPYASLFVEEGGAARAPRLRDSLATALPTADVWLREEIPARLHYSANPRIGDILISAAPGRRVGIAGRALPEIHTHGWDNRLDEMGAVFLAMGPGIAPGSRIGAFESVHVYPFVAHLLGLEPRADVDGRLEVLRPVLGR